MAEEKKEAIVSVDIGGLHGWSFIKEARLHPDQKFLVIDPRAGPPPDKEKTPPNLIYIRGLVEDIKREREDYHRGIPLPDKSIDRVLLEQVFDQVSIYLWRSLFAESNRILKKEGQLKIIDLARNRDELERTLPQYGFGRIKTRPLKKGEGNELTKEFTANPKLYSPPICIIADKLEDKRYIPTP